MPCVIRQNQIEIVHRLSLCLLLFLARYRLRAIALIIGQKIWGKIYLEQISYGRVRINGMISGLSPGKHGFHIHEFGDLSDNCKAAGGHYNPYGVNHGSPKDPKNRRHVGDLGNIIANENGKAAVNIIDKPVQLSGYKSVIGRSFVVHAGDDDLGRRNNSGSLKTGNAGSRLGCGVIGRLKTKKLSYHYD